MHQVYFNKQKISVLDILLSTDFRKFSEKIVKISEMHCSVSGYVIM